MYTISNYSRNGDYPKYTRRNYRKFERSTVIRASETLKNSAMLYYNCKEHGWSDWYMSFEYGEFQQEREEVTSKRSTRCSSYHISLSTLLLASTITILKQMLLGGMIKKLFR